MKIIKYIHEYVLNERALTEFVSSLLNEDKLWILKPNSLVNIQKYRD